MKTEHEATHRCTYCGAQWRKNDDGTWTLISEKCGDCCNNEPMGHQIVRLG